MTSPNAELTAWIAEVRKQFPALDVQVNGKALVYLDSAASAQTPMPVIEAMDDYYRSKRSNIHRGVHFLSQEASEAYEAVRPQAASFLGASDPDEIVFVRGTTEGLNLLAYGLGERALQPGDEVVVSEMEHHANFVPWQRACHLTGATLRVIGMDDRGVLDLERAAEVIGPRTKVVALSHVSNALGTVNPVAEVARLAHEHGAVVVVDAAQSVPHMPVDVTELGCDALVFSGHKLFGPTGIGVLWARRELLEAMPPYQVGGGMIQEVTAEKTTWADLPMKFEAGTPAIAEVIGLGAAMKFVLDLGWENIQAAEHAVFAYAKEQLDALPFVKAIGSAPSQIGVYSFEIEGVPAYDLGTMLDQRGVAVRTGHHCAQPTMRRFGVDATTRASFAFYNTFEEVDALVAGLKRVHRLFG